MKYPNIWNVNDLVKFARQNSAEINGKWEVARPLGFQSFRHRCKAAWLVFTGKADAVIFAGQ